MNAERFYADADGPEMTIDKADDGTPLVQNRGWTCSGCDLLYAKIEDAEACCCGRLVRLYTGKLTRFVNTA